MTKIFKTAPLLAVAVLLLALMAQAQCSSGSYNASITLVTVQNGQVMHLAPQWAINWAKKNSKKYPGVCFTTENSPVNGGTNYVIAFSASSSAVQGFEPVTQTNTTTTPVSGNGTVTDDQGDTWRYTVNGTETTTTTTTTQTPYTINSNALYLTAYNDKGEAISQRWHVFSSKQGGDPYNSAGYNLGSALGSIHARGHLLQHTVEDCVGKAKKAKK
jgi:hypothetical protein